MKLWLEIVGGVLVALIVGGLIGYFAIPHPKPEVVTVIDTVSIHAKDIIIWDLRGSLDQSLSDNARKDSVIRKQSITFVRLVETINFYKEKLAAYMNAPTDSSGNPIVPIFKSEAHKSYDDGRVSFDLDLSYSYYPADSFNFAIRNLFVKVPVSHEVVREQVPCTWKIWNGFVVSGDISFGNATRLDGRVSIPIGVASNWQIVPHAGYATTIKGNVGIGFNYGVFQ